MIEKLNDPDWENAFGEGCIQLTMQTTLRTRGQEFKPFTREDVAEILHIQDGYNDGPDWIGVFKLKDGRFIAIEAGCDYTGWDCQAGGAAVFSDDLNDLIRYGLSEDARSRFGIVLLEDGGYSANAADGSEG